MGLILLIPYGYFLTPSYNDGFNVYMIKNTMSWKNPFYSDYLQTRFPTLKLSTIFIAVICLSGLWFTMTFQNARFIWYIFPFIYIILLRVRKLRFIGYAFCLLVFYQSFQQFYSGFLRGPSSKYLLYLYENKITLPKEDSLLIAANGRHLYYFFNKGSYDTTPDSENNIIIPKELSWDLIENGSSLCISGDTPYIRSVHSQIRDMGIENGFGIQTKSLTPDLYEFEGWGLVELTFNKD